MKGPKGPTASEKRKRAKVARAHPWRPTRTELDVLGALHTCAFRSTSDVARALGISRQYAHAELGDLFERELVVKQGGDGITWAWLLTEKGRRVVAEDVTARRITAVIRAPQDERQGDGVRDDPELARLIWQLARRAP